MVLQQSSDDLESMLTFISESSITSDQLIRAHKFLSFTMKRRLKHLDHEIVTFGMHKGKTFQDLALEHDYCDWCRLTGVKQVKKWRDTRHQVHRFLNFAREYHSMLDELNQDQARRNTPDSDEDDDVQIINNLPLTEEDLDRLADRLAVLLGAKLHL